MLKRLLFRKATAREAWERAAERYQAAKRSGDTRSIHHAWEALKAATTQKLRAGA